MSRRSDANSIHAITFLKPADVVIITEVFSVPMISPSIHHPFGKPIVGRLANDRTRLVESCDSVQGFDSTIKSGV